MNNILALFETILIAVMALPVLYLLFLMIAAWFYRRPGGSVSGQEKFIILVPAHNEALTLPASLQAIGSLRVVKGGPAPRLVVIADNCTDDTAEIARSAGAEVLERFDSERRGKGHALEWAIDRLLQAYPAAEFSALVIFDADTLPDSAFLAEASRALGRGAQVIQGRYDILKQNSTWRTYLLYTALVIYNHVRPLGRAALKISSGLHGNGMVFRRNILETFPWQAFSLVEDIEYANRLVLAGYKVTYVPEARLYSQAAGNRQQATTQRLRWEGGRFRQVRQDVPKLLAHALRRPSFNAFDRAMDLIIPPLALLVLLLVGLTAFDFGLWWLFGGEALGLTIYGWVGLLAGVGLFVLGSLLAARAPLSAYLALLFAPFYVLWKLQIYARLAFRRAPGDWVRTPRTQLDLMEVTAPAPGVEFEKKG